jgi:hypothetical protein
MSSARKQLLLWFTIPWINAFFDGLVILNTLLLVTEIHLEDSWGLNQTQCSSFIFSLCAIQATVLCIFVVEVSMKVYALGLPRFWRSRLNQIDLLAIVASFLFLLVDGPNCGLAQELARRQRSDAADVIYKHCEGEMAVYNWTQVNATRFSNREWWNYTDTQMIGVISNFEAEHSMSGAGVQSFITLFRIIRIFRLARVLRGVRVELRVISKLGPLFARFLGVLFFFYYIFGVIGMEMFAGRMHYTIEAVQLSSYGQARYYENNFDNIYSTFMVLFELMVVNNWNIIMEGYVAATNSEWPRLYFIVWFIISVIVVMNVCAGFLIDAYSLLKPKMANEVKWLDKILVESDVVTRKKSKNAGGAETKEEMKQCCFGWCGDVAEYERLKFMTMSEILAHIDTKHMVSNMPSVSRASKDNILFDQQLQQQIGIRVEEHEHSYNQLTKVFDDGDDTEDEEDDESEEDI